MSERRVTILCSGVALGVYIPALVLRYQLRGLGLETDVVVLEDLYTPGGWSSLERLRDAFHERFELAKVAQRMTTSMRPHLDPAAVDALLHFWADEDRRDFIVWSGFWMPLLEEYRDRCAPRPVRVDICRIDAIESPSFQGSPEPTIHDREVWFWSWRERRLVHELPVGSSKPVPYDERDPQLVIHGGGWGLGEYHEVADEVAARGLRLQRVVYRRSEIGNGAGGSRTYMVDPEWRPWLRAAGRLPEFPPFGEVTGGVAGSGRFTSREECHELYRIIRRSRAIISKPGGGTLMDSLSSATPVVFLEPYGEAERRNADLWTVLGFGVPYGEWRSSGFDDRVLARLARNLATRPATTMNYPIDVAARARRHPTRAASAS